MKLKCSDRIPWIKKRSLLFCYDRRVTFIRLQQQSLLVVTINILNHLKVERPLKVNENQQRN